MFFEQRYIFQFEQVPSSPKKGPKFGPKKTPETYERMKILREMVSEKEKQQEEEEVRVEEKIINTIEDMGIACPRCGLKNVREDNDLPKEEGRKHLICLDCKLKWSEQN